jgi:hypothetical protein
MIRTSRFVISLAIHPISRFGDDADIALVLCLRHGIAALGPRRKSDPAALRRPHGSTRPLRQIGQRLRFPARHRQQINLRNRRLSAHLESTHKCQNPPIRRPTRTRIARPCSQPPSRTTARRNDPQRTVIAIMLSRNSDVSVRNLRPIGRDLRIGNPLERIKVLSGNKALRICRKIARQTGSDEREHDETIHDRSLCQKSSRSDRLLPPTHKRGSGSRDRLESHQPHCVAISNCDNRHEALVHQSLGGFLR